MEHIPRYEFQKCVTRYGGDYRQKGFSCWDQFLAMGFAQFTYRESLRDIEACLGSVRSKLYHMGFRSKIARSTLADANESRHWRIFADFAQVLIATARPLYAGDPIGVDLDASLYALDSTTIDLCLSLFPWAHFRQQKAAVKLHTLLDLHGNIPTFIGITDGKVHDVNMLDAILPEAGAFYALAHLATAPEPDPDGRTRRGPRRTPLLPSRFLRSRSVSRSEQGRWRTRSGSIRRPPRRVA